MNAFCVNLFSSKRSSHDKVVVAGVVVAVVTPDWSLLSFLTLMAIFHACRTDVQGREIHDALKKRELDVEHNRYASHGYNE